MGDVDRESSSCLADGGDELRVHLGDDQPAEGAGGERFGEEEAGLDRAEAEADERTAAREHRSYSGGDISR